MKGFIAFLVILFALIAGYFTVFPSNGIEAIDSVKLEKKIVATSSYIIREIDGNNFLYCKESLLDHESMKIWGKFDNFSFPFHVEQTIQSHLKFASNKYFQSLFENSLDEDWNRTAAGEEFESILRKSLSVSIPEVDYLKLYPRDWNWNWHSCHILGWIINFRVNNSATRFRRDLDFLALPYLIHSQVAGFGLYVCAIMTALWFLITFPGDMEL
jgi:hypothetical protein